MTKCRRLEPLAAWAREPGSAGETGEGGTAGPVIDFPLHRLFAVQLGGEGAARFGRRTAGPHARSAAPVQLHHEDCRHEAAMGGGAEPTVEDKAPEWVDSARLSLGDEAFCDAVVPVITDALRRRYPHRATYRVSSERIALRLGAAIGAANSGSLVATLDVLSFCRDAKLPLPPSIHDQVAGEVARAYVPVPMVRIGDKTFKEMQLRVRSAWMNRIVSDFHSKQDEAAELSEMDLEARSLLHNVLGRGHYERLFGPEIAAALAGEPQPALTPMKIAEALADPGVQQDIPPWTIKRLRRDPRLAIPDFERMRADLAQWETVSSVEFPMQIARQFAREVKDFLEGMKRAAAELRAAAAELRGVPNLAGDSLEADRALRLERDAADMERTEVDCAHFLLPSQDDSLDSYRKTAKAVMHLGRHMNPVEKWEDLSKGRLWPGRYYLPSEATLAACGIGGVAAGIAAAGIADDAPRWPSA